MATCTSTVRDQGNDDDDDDDDDDHDADHDDDDVCCAKLFLQQFYTYWYIPSVVQYLT